MLLSSFAPAADADHDSDDSGSSSVLRPFHAGQVQGTGWKKPYLIFGMCDETFSINYTAKIPEDVDKGWFMFVTLLNQIPLGIG